MKQLLLILWQLPQWLVSVTYRAFLKIVRTDRYKTTKVYWMHSRDYFGVSFFYIFLTDTYLKKSEERQNQLKAHEYGHCIQSLYLGWLYLLVIGIPSFLWANVFYPPVHRRCSYYSFYTERWADKLGGVVR